MKKETIERYNIAYKMPEFLKGVRSGERHPCVSCLAGLAGEVKAFAFVFLGHDF